MNKQMFALAILLSGVLALSAMAADESPSQRSVKGTVEKIILDENVVVLSGERFFITPDMVQYAWMEEGDNVELIIENTENGSEVVDYFYLFDEDDDETSSDVMELDNMESPLSIESESSE